MKEEKATAVMLILVGLAGLSLLVVIGLELYEAMSPDNIKMVERGLERAGRLKYLLKYSPLQRWVVVAFGGFLVFTGLTVMAWVNQRRL